MVTPTTHHIKKHDYGALGPLIVKHYLRRIRDDERLPCLLALASDTGYSMPPTEVRARYARAKQVRDLVGHSSAVAQVWNPRSQGWAVAIAHRHGQRGSRVPPEMTPATFDRLRADCKWIAEHVSRLEYEAQLSQFIDLTGQPAEPPRAAGCTGRR